MPQQGSDSFHRLADLTLTEAFNQRVISKQFALSEGRACQVRKVAMVTGFEEQILRSIPAEENFTRLSAPWKRHAHQKHEHMFNVGYRSE